jgi:methylated-DNA-[protein]-cysteine S-methyltransferase
MTHVYKTMQSPVGELKLVASEKGLTAILWENDPPHRIRLASASEDKNHPVLVEVERQLNDYFAGKRTAFSLPLDFRGTAFQKKVWAALLSIPFGETRSYGQIARQIKNPKAVRAVGAANGKNPISIIAPCHRVIGSNGALTGFAGGLDAKAFLLALEGKKIFNKRAAQQRELPLKLDAPSNKTGAVQRQVRRSSIAAKRLA